MIRNFKALGLALVAVLAMSAFVASAAQAAPVITTSAGTVGVHGTGEGIGEKFTVDGVTTECATSHYTGTANNNTSTLVLAPTYTGCTLAGTGLTVHVKTNECTYEFTLTSKSGGTTNALADVVCPTGKVIVIEGTGTSCEAQVGSQTGLNGVTSTNDATDVTIKPHITKQITATVTKDGFLCPFSGTGVKTEGTYTATGYITGTAASGTIQTSGE